MADATQSPASITVPLPIRIVANRFSRLAAAGQYVLSHRWHAASVYLFDASEGFLPT
jgi:hypothetical protein